MKPTASKSFGTRPPAIAHTPSDPLPEDEGGGTAQKPRAAHVPAIVLLVLFLGFVLAGSVLLPWNGAYLAALTITGLGMMVTMPASRWREFFRQRDLVVPLALLGLYLLVVLFNWGLIDNSPFATSRMQRQLHLIAFFPLIILLWRLRPHPLHILFAFSLGLIVYIIFVLLFTLHLGTRIGLTELHAVHMGNIVLWFSGAALAILVANRQHSGSWQFLFAVCAAIAGIGALLITESRGPFLALVGSLVVLVGIWLARQQLKLAIGAVAVLVLFGYGVTQTPTFQGRLIDIQIDLWLLQNHPGAYSSTSVRLELWRLAAEIAMEHPIAGAGFSELPKRIDAHVASGSLPTYFSRFRTEPHNEYLYLLSTRGLPGLISFLLLLGWLLQRSLRIMTASPRHGWSTTNNYVALPVFVFAVGTLLSGLTITLIDQRIMLNMFVYVVAVNSYLLWWHEQHSNRIPQASLPSRPLP